MTNIQEGCNQLVIGQTQTLAHHRIVGQIPRSPYRTQAHRMGGDEHIANRHCAGHLLLDEGHLGMINMTRYSNDHQRCAQRQSLVSGKRVRRKVRRLGQRSTAKELAQTFKPLAFQHKKPPRTQVRVIGRAQRRLEQGFTLSRGGRRSNQSGHRHPLV